MTDTKQPMAEFEDAVKGPKRKLKRLATEIVQDIVDILDVDLYGSEKKYRNVVFARLIDYEQNVPRLMIKKLRPLFDKLTTTLAELKESSKDEISGLSFLLGEHRATIARQAEVNGRLRGLVEEGVGFQQSIIGYRAAHCPECKEKYARYDNAIRCIDCYTAACIAALAETESPDQPGGEEDG